MKRLTICSTSLLALSLTGCAGVAQKFNHAQAISPPIESEIASTADKQQSVATHRDIATVDYRADLAASPQSPVQLAAQQATGQIVQQAADAKPIVRMALRPVNDPAPIANDASHSLTTAPLVTSLGHGPTYSLAEIEQIAISRNPALTAAHATSSKAAGLRSQVGVAPNPTFGFSAQQLADENTDQHSFFIEQEFVRGDKLRLNRDVLGHTTAAQRWEAETQRHRVLTDVRVRFYEAVAAQQQLDATREFEVVARRGVQVALDRQKGEEGTQIEVLQSKTLLSEIELAVERTEVAYRGAWRDLAAIAGLPEATPARLIAELDAPIVTLDWETEYQRIVGESPELAVARALVCEKAAMLKRQQVQMVPNITGQIGAGFDNGTDSGMLNVQLSAPIPVWNKNAGNISAAYSDYTRAAENVNRIERAIRSRLARVAQDFDASIASVKKYEQEIIPQASESLTLSEEAYKAGELEFLQVLIVRRSFYESTIRFIAAQGELAQAGAKVDGLLLTGGLDAPQDYTDGDGIRGASFGGQ